MTVRKNRKIIFLVDIKCSQGSWSEAVEGKDVDDAERVTRLHFKSLNPTISNIKPLGKLIRRT